MVVIPQKPSDLYREAKFLSDVKIGIPSQCIVARNAGIGCMPKRRDQYCSNLVLKINAKLGARSSQRLLFVSCGCAMPVVPNAVIV
jgi:eukaryotic translation initiation factor 2C